MKKLDNFINSITIDENDEDPYVDASLPLSPEVDPDYGEDEKQNWEALKNIDEKWSNLIKKYPEILRNHFKSNPKHQVYHKIELIDDKPVKTKVRPLLADSDKSILGKKVWEEMEEMGIIERVDPSSLTDYSSALHLVKKPSGQGWRPCIDFRPIIKSLNSWSSMWRWRSTY